MESSKSSKVKRRGNGQGTIYKYGNRVRWQYIVGYREDGSEIRVGGIADDADAARVQLAQVMADKSRGLFVVPDEVTVAQYAEIWLTRQLTVSARTIHNYKAELNYALQYIGEARVQEIHARDLKEVVTCLSSLTMRGGQAMAPQTLSRILTRLRALFREALDDEIINKDPMRGVKKPRYRINTQARERALNFDQEARLLAVGTALHKAGLCRLWPTISLMLRTGLRRSEALGLKWDAINYIDGTIQIFRTRVLDVEGIVTRDATKSDSSQRTLPVPKQVLDILRRHGDTQEGERRRLHEVWQDRNIVFATSTGDWTHVDNLNRALRFIIQWSDPARAMEGRHWIRVPCEHRSHLMAVVSAGERLPHISSHDLRHTYATLALRSGIAVNVVSKALGHKSVAITLEIYRHVSDDEVRKAIRDSFREPLPAPQMVNRILN